MKKQMIVAAALVASGLGIASFGMASAASDSSAADTKEMQALSTAKLSAMDAIKAVEAQQPGKVAEVEFDIEKGVASFEINILAADGIEHDFMVDANSGTVTKIAANEDQNGDDGDDENGDGDTETENK